MSSSHFQQYSWYNEVEYGTEVQAEFHTVSFDQLTNKRKSILDKLQYYLLTQPILTYDVRSKRRYLQIQEPPANPNHRICLVRVFSQYMQHERKQSNVIDTFMTSYVSGFGKLRR